MGDEIFSDDRHFRAELRAAGWVPLADVLDALRDTDGFYEWSRRMGPGGGYRDRVARYIAERFATAPEGADERNGHG